MSASSITRLASKILSRNETSLTVAELQQGAAAVQARLASGGIDANKRVHCPDGRCSMNLGPSAASISLAAPSSPSSFSLASLLPRGGKCTPLAFAIMAGDLVLVDVLLANGADPNKLSGLPHRFDFAPLHLAAALGSAAAVAKLLAAGADANARLDKCRGLAPKQEAALAASLKSTAAGYTALHLALDCTVSAAACCEVVKALLTHPGTNPNTRNHAGLTPLTVACKRKREDVVDLLLGVMTPSPPPSSAASLPPHGGGVGGLDSPYAGAHPRLDLNASGPLFAAIAAEDAGLVRKLLVAGAGVRHARNEEGLSPLAYAVCRGSTTFTNRAEVVSLLLAAGAPVESGLLQHAAEWPHVREALVAAASSSRLSAGSSSGTGSGSGSLRGSSTGYVGIAAGGSKRFDRGSQGYASAGGVGGGASSRASADGAAGLATGTGAGHTAAAAAAASPGAPPAVVMGLPLSPAVSTAPLITTTTTSSDTSTSSGTVQWRGRFSFISALAPGLGLSGQGPGGSCCLPPPPFSASSGILRAMQKNVCCSLMFFPMLLPVLVMALAIDALMPVAAALCSFLRIAVPVIALLCVLVLYGVIHLALQAAAPLLSTLSAAAAAAAGGAGTAVAPAPGLTAELAAGAGAGAGAGVVVLGAAEAGLEALGHAAGSAGLAVVSVLEHEVEAPASLVVNNLSNYVAAATAGPAPASASASMSGLAAVAAAASKALTGAVSAVLAALLPCGLASAAGGRTLGLDLWRWQGPLGLGAGLAAWFLGVVAAHALLGLAEEALVGYRPPGDRLRAFLQHRAAARHAGGGAISDEQLAAHARLCLPVALLLGGGTGVKLMPLTVLMVLLCLPTVAVSVRKEYERGLWQQQKQPATAAPAAVGEVAAAAAALKAQGAVQATTQAQAQVQFVGLEKAGLGQRARR